MSLIEAALSNAIVAIIPALLALIAARAFRRPAVTRALWLLVFLKLLTPPLAPLPCWPTGAREEMAPVVVTTHVPAEERATAARAQTNKIDAPSVAPTESPPGAHASLVSASPGAARTVPTASAVLTREQSIMLAILVWVAGAIITLLLTGFRVWRFWQLVRLAELPTVSLQRRVQRLSARMGLRTPPLVRVLPGLSTPMVWAPWSAFLVMPRGLLNEMNESQLDALVAHELAHLRGRDHWVRRLEIIVSSFYWWHPVVWLAKRGVREAEEQICDAWVVDTLPDVSTTYANTLLDVVSQLSGHRPYLPPVAMGLSQFHHIKRRITMIMRGTTSPQLNILGWLTILTVAAIVVPISPTLGQSEPTEVLAIVDATDPGDLAVTVQADAHAFERDDVAVVATLIDDDDRADSFDSDRDDLDHAARADAKAAVGDMLDDMREAIAEMDEEVREAIEEAREELREMVDEADESVQREMLDIDLNAIIKEAVAEAPQPVRVFIREVDPALVVESRLDEVKLEIQDFEPDEKLRDKVQRKIERFLKQHIDELSVHTRKQVRTIQQEIKREARRAPATVQRVLAKVDFDDELAEVAETTSPVVQRVIADIHVQEMVNDGLISNSQNRKAVAAARAREGREQASRQRQRATRTRNYTSRDSRDRDSDDRRFEVLERRLERLLREAEGIVEELEELKKDRDRDDAGR